VANLPVAVGRRRREGRIHCGTPKRRQREHCPTPHGHNVVHGGEHRIEPTLITDRPESCDGGFPYERMVGATCAGDQRGQLGLGHGSLAERERSGFCDQRLGVGQQRDEINGKVWPPRGDLAGLAANSSVEVTERFCDVLDAHRFGPGREQQGSPAGIGELALRELSRAGSPDESSWSGGVVHGFAQLCRPYADGRKNDRHDEETQCLIW